MCKSSGPVLLLAIYLFHFCIIGSANHKSLFDELPLNGALSFDGTKLSEFQFHSAVSSDSKSKKLDQEFEHGKLPGVLSHVTSLFDELPNQGALKNSNPNFLIRNPRNPLLSLDVSGNFEYGIEPIKPKQEKGFNVIMGRTIIPPRASTVGTRNNLMRSPSPASSFFKDIVTTFPVPGLQHRIPLITHSPNKPPNPKPMLKSGFSMGEKFNRSFHHISANAAGPTVIVYANHNGKNEPNQKLVSDNNNSHPRPNLVSKPTGVNEIHYHYHFNDEEKNATLTKKPKKPTLYGKQNRKNYGGGVKNGSRWEGYKEGYNHKHLASNLPKFTDSEEDSSSSSEEEDDEDYAALPPRQESPKIKSRQSFSSLSYEQPPSENEPVPPPSYYESPSSSTSPPPTYGPPHSYGSQNSNSYEPQPTSSNTYEPKPPPSNSYPPPSNNYGPPSEKYGPPPPPSNYGPPAPPPNKYGPPPSNDYGPPAPPSSTAGPPAPPSNDQPLVSEDRYHTTITLQTLPVTKQITEFVQVPNIVHHISSSQQSHIPNNPVFQDEPPPSGGYGPPGSKETSLSNNSNKRPKMTTTNPPQSGFQAHLSKLLGSTGLPNGNSASFLDQHNRNKLTESELLQLLSLSDSSLSSQYAPFSHQGSSPLISSGIVGGNSLFGRILQGIPFPIISGPTSSSDSNVESLKEVIREQRYQNILNDLRSRVREESKSADRARSDYRSLFSRGALLLSALTLLPRVVSPFATATAAAGGASTLTNYMLPLIPATGRRRRSIEQERVHQLQDVSRCSSNAAQIATKMRLCEHNFNYLKKCKSETAYANRRLCSLHDLYAACKSLIKHQKTDFANYIKVCNIKKVLVHLQLSSRKRMQNKLKLKKLQK